MNANSNSSNQPLDFGLDDSLTIAGGYTDWILGLPDSESAQVDHTMLGLEDSILLFDQDIDNACLAPTDAPFDPILNMDIDWTSILNSAPPFSPPAFTPSLAGDHSSSLNTTLEPLSPGSDETLVNSPLPGTLLGLHPVENAKDDTSGLFDGFQFSFEYDVSRVDVPCLSMPPSLTYLTVPPNGPGGLHLQHDASAAAAETAFDSQPEGAQGLQVNAEAFPFPFMTPALPPSHPPTPTQQAASIVEEKTPTRRIPDELETERPAKRRRSQDTTPRFECEHCGKKSARTHNLKVHVASVHKGERSFACAHAGCSRAFSRKHDLTRHVQSEHTGLGSPRKKGKSANKSAKSRRSSE